LELRVWDGAARSPTSSVLLSSFLDKRKCPPCHLPLLFPFFLTSADVRQKRMSDDRISNPTLNYGHLSVYQGRARGMCLDLEWHDSTAEERGGVEIETIEVGDIEGDAFRGFEGAFFDEGGRIGGW